jgi:mono/diheme cytochrome c family protein
MSCFLKARFGYCAVLLALAMSFLMATAVALGNLQKRKTSRTKQVEELFNKNCARCHGADGRGETPQGKLFKAPNFTDPEWWQKNSRITNPRAQRSIIIRGKATMPAFGKKLTRSEINLLLGQIRSFRQAERKR